MRTYFINLIIKITLIFSPLLGLAEDETHLESVSGQIYISENRRGLSLEVINETSEDLFCKEITVTVEYCNSYFCEIVGENTIKAKNQYINFQSKINLNLSEISERFLKKSPDAIINRIKSVSLDKCEKTNFISYCKYSDKSDSEVESLEKILKYLKAPDCNLSIDKIYDMNLSRLNLRNLKALKYFSKLERLNLSQNYISDLEPIRNLPNLWYLDVRENPIENFEEYLERTQIQRLYSHNVDIDINLISHVSNKIKYLEINDTYGKCPLILKKSQNKELICK